MLVEFKNLHTYFKSGKGVVKAVNGVNFSIPENSTVAIVGESGCGKSVTALSLMGLIDKSNGSIPGGEILFDGVNLLELSDEERRRYRGKEMAMIFQEPMTSLNPALKIGYQLSEVYRVHFNMSKDEAKKKSIEMLGKVKINNPEKIHSSYPHELSGGQRQRVMIAMALSAKPRLLIADEPTTALDVTIQAQVLSLMKELKEELGTSIMFITHDLGVVAEMADYIVVMYAGRVIERGSALDIFDNPLHPYTRGLLKARPRLGMEEEELFNIKGSVPNPIDLKPSCYFYDRCPHRMDICSKCIPPEVQVDGQLVSCFLYGGSDESIGS